MWTQVQCPQNTKSVPHLAALFLIRVRRGWRPRSSWKLQSGQIGTSRQEAQRENTAKDFIDRLSSFLRPVTWTYSLLFLLSSLAIRKKILALNGQNQSSRLLLYLSTRVKKMTCRKINCSSSCLHVSTFCVKCLHTGLLFSYAEVKAVLHWGTYTIYKQIIHEHESVAQE